MITVGIIKNWNNPDILKQSSGSGGVWGNVKFVFEKFAECDYLIVLNYSRKKTKILCPAENIWCILQEPPNEYFKYWHRAPKIFKKVITQDASLKGKRYIYDHPALPWQVNRDYDFLKQSKIPDKQKKLSWVTSQKNIFKGHKERMNFLRSLKQMLHFSLIATYNYHEQNQTISKSRKQIKEEQLNSGFTDVVEDKWAGLSPFRYSLAIENFQGPYYWSEKLADCFLSYTMPIYYGCTNLDDYFPKESYVRIDIKDPDVYKKIKETINSNLWKKNLDAIIHARKLVLDKYQFFPFVSDLINKNEKVKNMSVKKINIIPPGDTIANRVTNKIKKIIEKINLS